MITPGFRPMASWLALVYSKPNLSLKLIIREAKMEAEDIERYRALAGSRTKKPRTQEAGSRSSDRRRIHAPIRQCTPFHQRHRHLLARRKWISTSVCSTA